METMTSKLTCNHPDGDCPKLLCGHPLPCPLHTVTLDTTTEPPEITIPVTAHRALQMRAELATILNLIAKDGNHDSQRSK